MPDDAAPRSAMHIVEPELDAASAVRRLRGPGRGRRSRPVEAVAPLPGPHVLLVDDHVVVRSGLRSMLDGRASVTVVGDVATWPEARQVNGRAGRPTDVAIVAETDRHGGTFVAVRELTSLEQGRLRVLVLTARDSVLDEAEVVRVGGSGVVRWDVGADELAAAVSVAAAGYVMLSTVRPAGVLDEVALRRSARGRHAHGLGSLTSREVDVLCLMARGLANAEIADALTVSQSTVKSHVQHVLTKLGVRSRLHAVVLAYEQGLTGTAAAG